MTTLAIDIGGTKLAAALIDSRLTLLERREVPTPASQTPAALAAALAALVALSARADRFAIASTGIIQDGILTAINPANLGGLAFSPAGVFIRPHGVARYCPQ
jgi:N-acylmannosamine kinase